MRESCAAAVESWWADLLAVDADDLWNTVTVREHRRLSDYPGHFVAWRLDGVHVSTPAGCVPRLSASLESAETATLQDEEFWRSFAKSQGLSLIGPSTHAYLDLDPGSVPGLGQVTADDLRELRGQVDESEWEESGFAEHPRVTFGWYEHGELVAAANLSDFAEAPRDVGVLVAPSARGRQLVDVVGRAAASYAIEHHGFARWRARTENAASLRAADRLGFEEWCTQLAVR